MNPLEVSIGKLKFKNPLILASGILGVAPSSMTRLAKAGIGGMTTKTVGPRPRIGYSNPSIIEIDEDTFLNSVGLANPGIDAFISEIQEIKQKCDANLIVSVFGDGPEGFVEIAQKAEKAGADAIEINVSCPHAEVASISLSPELTKLYAETVKQAISIPLFVKLTPNIANMIPIAKAAEEGGADAIVAINTVRAISIDIQSGRPILSHGVGGLSGRAVRPIGVRFVYEIAPEVSIPVIGCGGVFNWQDVLEYIYAGASAVQIGSAFYHGDVIISQITEGLSSFLESKSISSLSELIGKAHSYKDQLEGKPRECPI